MNSVELFAPEYFWKIPEEERKHLRCGPGRGIIEKLVPETIYGLRITSACAIHDVMYLMGTCDKDKVDADDIFLNNMVRIIEAKTRTKPMLLLRLRRARTYYTCVRVFGGPAFWKNKNKPTEMGVV